MLALEIPLIHVAYSDTIGVDRRSLARSAESGGRVRVRRGVYVAAPEWGALDAPQRHVLRMRAVQARSARSMVFSHWSAAALHGLPVPGDRLRTVHHTAPPGTTGSRSQIVVHPLPLSDRDVVDLGGLRVTSPARTAVDIAAIAGFRDAVVVADALLGALGRRRPADGRQMLLAAWDRAQPRRAMRKVQAVFDFADAGAESVGESVSRVTMRTLGVPAPVLQHEFRNLWRVVARTDFWWPRLRVVGEMDGRMKYTDPRLHGGDPAAVLYEEKRREDEVRAMGVRFVRWGWEEAQDPRLLGPLLAAAGVVPERRAA